MKAGLTPLEEAMDKFSEDDLKTFEGWLKYQGFDAATLAPDELAQRRNMFDEGRSQAASKVGLIKLSPLLPGEHRYAVAVRDGSLWLVLWVRRSKKGEFFVMIPRADQGWDPHTSYHLNGTLHSKSYGRKFALPHAKCQPLTCDFKGIGTYGRYGPKAVGAKCDPNAFSGIVEVAPGVLGLRHGSIVVDLVEPRCEPPSLRNVVQQGVFQDIVPWVVISIVSP
jgi:hypothetical protein